MGSSSFVDQSMRTAFHSLSVVAVALCVCASIPMRAGPVSLLTVAGCSLPNHDLAGAWQTVLDLGFSGIEIAVVSEKETGPDRYPWVVVDRLDAAERTRLKALVAKFRHIPTHLPYGPELRQLTADPAVREHSRWELCRA